MQAFARGESSLDVSAVGEKLSAYKN